MSLRRCNTATLYAIQGALFGIDAFHGGMRVTWTMRISHTLLQLHCYHTHQILMDCDSDALQANYHSILHQMCTLTAHEHGLSPDVDLLAGQFIDGCDSVDQPSGIVLRHALHFNIVCDGGTCPDSTSQHSIAHYACLLCCVSIYVHSAVWCLTGFSSRQRNSNIRPRVIVLTFIKHLPQPTSSNT